MSRYMKYEDIFNEFCNKFPNVKTEDYRPAFGLYIDELEDCMQIPNSIIIWLKDGSKIIYTTNNN